MMEIKLVLSEGLLACFLETGQPVNLSVVFSPLSG